MLGMGYVWRTSWPKKVKANRVSLCNNKITEGSMAPDCKCKDFAYKLFDLGNRHYKGQGQKLPWKSEELVTGYLQAKVSSLYPFPLARVLNSYKLFDLFTLVIDNTSVKSYHGNKKTYQLPVGQV